MKLFDFLVYYTFYTYFYIDFTCVEIRRYAKYKSVVKI